MGLISGYLLKEIPRTFRLSAEIGNVCEVASTLQRAGHRDQARFGVTEFSRVWAYTPGIVYNTFPWPEATDQKRDRIRALAQEVLDARLQFPGSTLADLYDPDVMPRELRRAHRALDGAVDKSYRAATFTGDRDRVEHLFGLYEKLVHPLVSAGAPPARRKKGVPTRL